MKKIVFLPQQNMPHELYIQGGRGSVGWLEPNGGRGPGVWRGETEKEGERQSHGLNKAKIQTTQ